MSWKIDVQLIDEEHRWYGNALRFATKEEAERSAAMLMNNWTQVEKWQVSECNDEATDTYRKLVDVLIADQRAEVDPFNVGRHGPPERSQEV